MQDRYTGDIGDFGKLALLRALSPGRKVGVGWYLTTGIGESNNDGNHVGYLTRPERFRHLDAEVFDTLRDLLGRCERGEARRCVQLLESSGLLGQAVFHAEPVPHYPGKREPWATRMIGALACCDLVFVDPDNGLETKKSGPKCITDAEIEGLLRRGRTVVIYHHQTRFKGGATAEAAFLAGRLRALGVKKLEAVRLRPYSPRFYFVAEGDDTLSERVHAFVRRWGSEVEHFNGL